MKHAVISAALAVLAFTAFGAESASNEERIGALEEQVRQLTDELMMQQGNEAADNGGFRFGGYGDVHANLTENGKSVFDIHRLVFYVGYQFSDWIMLHSEVEIEHAYVTDGAGGEVVVEQLYVDFLLNETFNVRAGRMLAPLGIINQNHEPTLFFGVERPNVDKYIIPSTWSVEGAGIFGRLTERLSYQGYLVGGLDGSGFSADEGIRGGRIKERNGLNDPAVTGRIDLHPFTERELRLGLSGYYGGTDNANKGGPGGTDNDFAMVSADFEYAISRFRLCGVVADGRNSDPLNLPAGTGEKIFGWYLEGGVSVMPESWKTGRLAEADLIPFVRYEEYDTQHMVPSGTLKDGANDRTDITVGIHFPLTVQFVLKADYQIRSDRSATDPDNVFNLGMGWAF